MDILNYFLDSLRDLCSVTGILYLVLGCLGGLVLGAIPGLGGGTLMVLLLPISYKMNVVLAMALFVSIYIGGISGGCIGSVLLGIPGTASSLCTVWDGYEFTKQGNPVRPLSNAVVCNFIGTVPSILLAVFLCKVIAEVAVKLGPWEYGALCFAAVTMVVGLTKGDMAKGFIAVALAILLASVGGDPINATKRLTFGNINLYGGFSIINIMLGMFASKIILMEYASQSKVDASSKIKVERFRFPGKDLIQNLGTVIRSWITGAVIGFLPGLGGPVASVLAYSNERNIAKNKSEWGRGAIGGVIASETANNATCGGAMIPMIALGIPGDAAMVQFIAVLSIQGINVGPMLMRTNPDIVYMIFTAGIIAGILCLLCETLGMPLFPAILKIPYHYLYPAVLVVCFIGAYMVTGTLFGLIVTIGACLLGFIMDYFDVPNLPFIMTYILSTMLEKNIRQGLNFSGNGILEFFTRPFSCLFICAGLAVLICQIVVPIVKNKKTAKAK